jgi:DHA1 family bicyclomycin/chloramphenicol resistance-like MFS transporter
VVLVAVAFFIVETLPESRRHVAGHSTLRDRYARSSATASTSARAIIGGMTFTGLFGYLSTSSFLFQQVYAFTAQQYGLLFAVNSVGIIIGVQTSSRLMRGRVRRSGSSRHHRGALARRRHHRARLARAGFWGTAIPLWIYILACGFSFPARAGARPRASRCGGLVTAASLLGALNFGSRASSRRSSASWGSAAPSPWRSSWCWPRCSRSRRSGRWCGPKTVPPLSD